MPRVNRHLVVMGVKVEPRIAEEIEALTEQLQLDNPAFVMTRSDVLRRLLIAGLQHQDALQQKTPSYPR